MTDSRTTREAPAENSEFSAEGAFISASAVPHPGGGGRGGGEFSEEGIKNENKTPFNAQSSVT